MKAKELKAWLVTVTDAKGKPVKTVNAPSKYAAKQVANRLFASCEVGQTVAVESKAA
jgi:hypothetical protein